MEMDWASLSHSLILALLIIEGRLIKSCQECYHVCAYTNTGERGDACFLWELSCRGARRIEILNNVCGVRNSSFDKSCLSDMHSECSQRNSCCIRQDGDKRWSTDKYYSDDLRQKCYGKQHCSYRAPVDKLPSYIIHYCYILYRCSKVLTKLSTNKYTVNNTYPSLRVDQHKTVSQWTTNIVPIYSTTNSSNPSKGSRFPLAVCVVSLVLALCGLLSGAALWQWKRYKRKKRMTALPADNDGLNQRDTHAASNHYEVLISSVASKPNVLNEKANPVKYDEDNMHNTCKDSVPHFSSAAVKVTDNCLTQHPCNGQPQTARCVHTLGNKVEGCFEERINNRDLVNNYNEISFIDMDIVWPSDRTCDVTENANTITNTDKVNYYNLGSCDTLVKTTALKREYKDIYSNETIATGTTEYFILEGDDHYNEIDPEYFDNIINDTKNNTSKTALERRKMGICLNTVENEANDTGSDTYFTLKADGGCNEIVSDNYHSLRTETDSKITQATTLQDRKTDICLSGVSDLNEAFDTETAEYFILEAEERHKELYLDDHCSKKDETKKNDKADGMLEERNMDRVHDTVYNAINLTKANALLLDQNADTPSRTEGPNGDYYSNFLCKGDSFRSTSLNVKMLGQQSETNATETNEYFTLELQETDQSYFHLCAEPSTPDSEYNRILLFKDRKTNIQPTYHGFNGCKTAVGETVEDTGDYSAINNNVIHVPCHALNEYSHV